MISLLRRQAGAVAVYHLLLVAVGVAVLANPAVSTFDVQRRDRLAPATVFVEFASRFFTGGAPDQAARTRYEELYTRSGAEAVVEAMLARPGR